MKLLFYCSDSTSPTRSAESKGVCPSSPCWRKKGTRARCKAVNTARKTENYSDRYVVLGECEWKKYIQVYNSNFYAEGQVDQWLISGSDVIKWLSAPSFWSTGSFPFGSRTGFSGFFDTFFLSWFGARLSKCLDHSSHSTNLWSHPLRFFAPYCHWSPGFTPYHLDFVALPVWSIDRQDRRGRFDCLSTVEYALVCLSGRQGISSRPSTWWGPQPTKKSGVKLCSD